MPVRAPRKLLYLLGTDGSGASEKAFDRAIELAKNGPADLLIVMVDDLRLAHAQAMTGGAMTASYAMVDAASNEIVASCKRRAERAGLHADALVVSVADPAAEIVRQARKHSAEMVIVGSHGRTGITRMLLGSVAEKVVRHAPCSVLVVR